LEILIVLIEGIWIFGCCKDRNLLKKILVRNKASLVCIS